MKRSWFVVAILWATLFLGGGHLPAAETVTVDLSKWTPSDIAAIGEDPFRTRLVEVTSISAVY